ncbi:MAG: DUF5916 domain-containing protein [Balneolaceae bacterium]
MRLFSVIIFNILLQIPLQAQSILEERLVIPRLNEAIVFDGRVEDPVWDTIEPLPVVSYEPKAGLSSSEPTEIRIAHDDNYIYASIRAFDSNPSDIRINSLYRGRLSGDDLFHILLDTYNDNESAIVFTVTPGGVKWDANISSDGEQTNSDFETYWDVETHVDKRGWFAEVRIPFSSIGFQSEDGRVEMGLLVQRMISRKNERVIFPEVPGNISQAYFRSSLAHKVVFEGINSNRPLHFKPYLTGGIGHENLLNEAQNGYSRNSTRDLDAGFDVKYGISNNLNLDLTVNTDFAQIEADDQQVNLTRFNLFSPEKRQFFQERSGVFEFNTGGSGRLFHSRRIGLTSEGNQVRILGGGRLTGRIGSWDVGLINMQTDKLVDKPAENFGVVRLRRGILNSYSYTGAMATSRIDVEDGSYNIGYGLDGSIRLADDDYLTWVWAQTIEEETRDLSALATSRLRVHYERRLREGLTWETTLSRSGEAYNPGVGFIDRLDYLRLGHAFEYGWMPGETSPLSWHSLQMSGAVWWRTTTGEIEAIDYGPSWNATTNRGDQVNAGITWYYEDNPIEFSLLGRTTIPVGEYKFIRGVAGYQMGSGRQFRTQIELDIGSFYNGWRYTIDFSPTWNISKHLELAGSWFYNLVNVPFEEDWFSAHIGQLRVRTALNTHLSTNALIQFNTSANIVLTNVRIRYYFEDGHDFWIVFNEGMNTNRDRLDLVLPRSDSRTILFKYSYTFHL